MQRRHFRAPALALAGVLAGAAAAGAQDLTATAADREALDLTVYGNGLALVKDRRRVELHAGIKDLAITGISPQMIADSAHLGFGGDVRVLTQSLLAANLNPRRLLEAHVGRTVNLVRTNPVTGERNTVQATIVAAEGGVIARIGGQLVSNPRGEWVFDEIPGHLRGRPVLAAQVESAAAGMTPLELRYLTGAMTWRAAYTADWDAAAEKLTLRAWATLGNGTGADFDNAEISVVAGQVRRITAAPRPMSRGKVLMRAEAMAADAAAAEPAREELAGYHLYRLPERVTLKRGEEVQAALLAPLTVETVRELVSEIHPTVFGRVQGGGDRPRHPAIRLSFTNPKDDRGMPLPAGAVRLYGADAGGAARFLGEDRLPDTPVGGTVELSAGNAFDVTVKRRQTDFRRDDRRSTVTAYAIEIHNGGATSETVKVVETVPGDWRMEDTDRPHTRENNQAVWRIAVPAKQTVRFSYRVLVRN